MPERHLNEEAVRQIEEITGCPPPNGEELIESEDLKRQLREAKERLKRTDSHRRAPPKN